MALKENGIRLLVSFFLVCHCYGDSAILSPLSNGKYELKVGKELLSSKDCVNCHKKIHNNWESSQHARSYTNILFQHGLGREPRVWCLNCHAPLHNVDQNLIDLSPNTYVDDLAKEGVNCAVCHVREGKIYGKRENTYLKEHKVFEDKKLMSKELCTNCHNFNFPKTHSPVTSYNDNPMQSTGAEFNFSYIHLSGRSCQSCHLAKDHVLGGSNNREFLKSNLKFKISEVNTSKNYSIKFRVSFDKIGHNFPTGDLFRALSLQTFDAKKKLIGEYVFHKKVRVIDAFVQQDTTIKLKPFAKSLEQEVILESEVKPEICKISYHYQKPIEDQLRGKLLEKEFIFELYNGACRYN